MTMDGYKKGASPFQKFIPFLICSILVRESSSEVEVFSGRKAKQLGNSVLGAGEVLYFKLYNDFML